jgi:hypothetical protein
VTFRSYFRMYVKTYGKNLDKLIAQSKDECRLLNVLIAYAVSDRYAYKRIAANKTPEAQRIINQVAEFFNEDQYDYSYWTAAIMKNLKSKFVISPPSAPLEAEYCKADIEKLVHGYMSKRYISSRQRRLAQEWEDREKSLNQRSIQGQPLHRSKRGQMSFIRFFVIALRGHIKYYCCKHFHKRYHTYFKETEGNDCRKCSKCGTTYEVGSIELRSFFSYLSDYWD